jgi:hypothetical protein
MAKGRKTGGRKRGTPNKISGDVRALALEYVPDALVELARLAAEAESEAARLSAIREILDRAFGKAAQQVSGDEENPVAIMLTGVRETLARKLDRIAKTRDCASDGAESDGCRDADASL